MMAVKRFPWFRFSGGCLIALFLVLMAFHVVIISLSAMGVVPGISLKTEGALNQDLTLSAFDVELTSNLFSFQARGKVDRDQISIVSKVAG
jgi:uncharacterized membrane protein